jgi:hypothetical protein
MSKKTTKLSYTLLGFLMIFFILATYFSYDFYRKSTNVESPKTVRSNDILSIDSIKKISVEDTVKYFNIKIDILKNQISEKDTLIKKYQNDIQKVLKIKDSISFRLESTRMKLREANNRDTIK